MFLCKIDIENKKNYCKIYTRFTHFSYVLTYEVIASFSSFNPHISVVYGSDVFQAPKLALCGFLIKEGYLKHIHSKTTFHRMWNNIKQESLENWIRGMGYISVVTWEDSECAVDSSGFKITTGGLWRYLKWAKGQLKKTSKIFRKVHSLICSGSFLHGTLPSPYNTELPVSMLVIFLVFLPSSLMFAYP